MTFEDGWGAVFNQEGRGCPLWYYGAGDYRLAHAGRAFPASSCDEVRWVLAGFQAPDGVSVVGTAEVADAVLTRRINGHDEVRVPGSPRPAKVPRWRVTLQASTDSWVSLPGASFQDAVERVFRAGGRTS